jgi:large conductance mechanosensitive channel
MSLIKEFKAFAVKGNMVDMAVGIIIGGAFGKIVSSLVADVVMPPIGMLLGSVNFTDLAVTLQEAGNGADAVQLRYGSFLQTVVDFLIVAVTIFMVVKGMSALKKKESAAASAAPPEPSKQETLLAEIRDELRRR